MLNQLRVLIIIHVHLDFVVHWAASTNIQAALLKRLLNNTHPLVRPILDRENTLKVSIGIELIQIDRIDETRQHMLGKYWSRMSWRNELMIWNATEWNIDFLQVAAYKVWTPDIVLYNNAASHINGALAHQDANLIMLPNGTHIWRFPVTYDSSCQMTILYFPFDGHMCHLKFGSWTFSNKYISLDFDASSLVTSHYIHSTEWDLINLTKSKHSIVYDGYGPIPYDDVTFNISVARLYLGHIFYMIGPCLLLILIILCSFSLKPDCGERIMVVVTNLLGFSFLMKTTNEVLPTNSDTISFITVFYLILVIESASSLFMAICVVAAFFRSEQYDPPEIPKWLKFIYVNIYARFFHIDKNVFIETAPNLIEKSLKIEFNNNSKAEIRVKTVENRITNRLIVKHERPVSLMEISIYEGNKSVPRTLPTFLNSNTASEGILTELKYLRNVSDFYWKQRKLQNEWKVVADMLDRLYFWIFFMCILISTTYMLMICYTRGSDFGRNAILVAQHKH